MKLLVDIGKAYSAMAIYDCRKAIELLEQLPLHQLTTSCMLEKLAICYYESGNNDMVRLSLHLMVPNLKDQLKLVFYA